MGVQSLLFSAIKDPSAKKAFASGSVLGTLAGVLASGALIYFVKPKVFHEKDDVRLLEIWVDHPGTREKIKLSKEEVEGLINKNSTLEETVKKLTKEIEDIREQIDHGFKDTLDETFATKQEISGLVSEERLTEVQRETQQRILAQVLHVVSPLLSEQQKKFLSGSKAAEEPSNNDFLLGQSYEAIDHPEGAYVYSAKPN